MRGLGPIRKGLASSSAASAIKDTPSSLMSTEAVVDSFHQARKAVTTKLAAMVPQDDRRAIIEHWAAQGDPAANAWREAEAQMHVMKAEMKETMASEKRALDEVERLRSWVDAHSKIKGEDATHPMLGQLVSDLGYKKVYCASVNQLGAVPIWEMQRILRKDRAESIAREKRKKGFPVKIPGIITLYALSDGSFKLLDGQHRLAALNILADTGIVNGDSNFVLVEVFHLEKETEAKPLFLEINSAQPVKLIDLPDSIRPDIKKVIDGATEHLLSTFPDFFKISQNPKVPHLNVDNLRDDLYQHHTVERHGIQSADELVAWLQKANDALGSKNDKDWKRIFKGRNMDVIEKAVGKARKGNFFLGLERTWLSL